MVISSCNYGVLVRRLQIHWFSRARSQLAASIFRSCGVHSTPNNPHVTVQSLVSIFSSEEYSTRPVWSLADLISKPERQKELRSFLESLAVDEYQFLRWRNALAAPDMTTALSALAHNLVTTPSLFSPNHNSPSAGKKHSASPFNQPSWLALAIVNSKIRGPQHLSIAYEWFRYLISRDHHSKAHGSFVAALIEAGAKMQFYSGLPILVNSYVSLRRSAFTVEDFHRVIIALANTQSNGAALKSSGGSVLTAVMFDKDTHLIDIFERMKRAGYDVMGEDTQKVVISIARHLGLRAIRYLRRQGSEKSGRLSYLLSRQALSQYASIGMTRRAASELDSIRRARIARKHPVVPVSSGFNKSAYTEQPNSASSASAVNIKTRGKINRETITPLNILFISSFARDSRSRDLHRFPHPLFAYLQRLRLHVDSNTNMGRSSEERHRLLSTFLAALSMQDGFSAKKLFDVLEGLDNTRLDPAALASIVKGLARRGDAAGALRIWDTYIKPQIQQSSSSGPHFASAAVHAFTANNRLADAFDILDSCGKQGLNVHVVSDFVRKLAHNGRPHLCYYLWDNMEAMYGIRPNDSILNTILITASSFSSREHASRMVDLLGFGWSRSRSDSSMLAKESKSRSPQDHSIYVQSVLKGEVESDGFWWHGRQAWQRAKDVFRDVILGNWPELNNVEIPAVANLDGMAPFMPGRPFFFPRMPKSVNRVGTKDQPLPVGPYYDIIPSRRSFDAYMRLLCAHNLADEIPETLAWQRALGIAPSRHTLRLALTRFAEVGEAPPIFEDAKKHIGFNFQSSPIENLRAWIIDWVGRDNCPTERELAMTRTMIGYRDGAGTQGKESDEWREYQEMLEKTKTAFRRNRGDLRRKEKRVSRWVEQGLLKARARRAVRKARKRELTIRRATLG
ncbi:uncharacterized protein EI90DRAFT_3056243 [Cantharellus anzutake]|uniref:uncharacterized protein n=1 Tax=Cantharellus anzutake TaxID=1750568 RepID=UPI0019051DC7|nr:uncharacterized protein EI90DRAFT_3056243 [Cantharellus anzutake]KAF8332009.1 hypothetical protein EI90DRAFT_3056243 [Cantharellus anzutake]